MTIVANRGYAEFRQSWLEAVNPPRLKVGDNIHPSNTWLSQFNGVTLLAFVIINITLRGADVFVTSQYLHHTYTNAFVGQLSQKLTSTRMAACTFDTSQA